MTRAMSGLRNGGSREQEIAKEKNPQAKKLHLEFAFYEAAPSDLLKPVLPARQPLGLSVAWACLPSAASLCLKSTKSRRTKIAGDVRNGRNETGEIAGRHEGKWGWRGLREERAGTPSD